MGIAKYLHEAEKFLAYFERNIAESGEYWRYGYDQAAEWIRLLRENEPTDHELRSFITKIKYPPEAQGSAFDEMALLATKWHDESVSS